MYPDYNPQPRYFDVYKEPIIGIGCSLVNTLLDCAGQITIGDYVSFGHDVKILTSQHDYNLRKADRQRESKIAPVTIKDGAWICTGSIILMGVTIGEDAVVGAGSVVTKDVPGGELWAGNPAKFIKKI